MKVEKSLCRINASLKELKQQEESLVEQVEQLTATGVLEATPHWRGGKYLYLMFPSGSKPPKQYIGVDTLKQNEALADVERYRQREVLQKQLEDKRQLILRTERAIEAISAGLDEQSGKTTLDVPQQLVFKRILGSVGK